jgi:hypothetical protein
LERGEHMARRGNYDRAPFVPVGPASSCDVGWAAILDRLRPLRSRKRCVLAVECYPGVDVDGVRRTLADGLLPVHLVELRQAYKDVAEIEKMCAPYLGDDPVFGRMNRLCLADFFEPGRSAVLRGRADAVREGLVLIVGAGASLLCPPDVVVYADLARGQIRERQKRGEVKSLGVHDQRSDPGRLLKRSFFIDWRAADRHKRSLLDRVDWLLDTNDSAQPKLIAGAELRRGLAETARRPFRVVPCFDPGVEAGRWLGETCRLPGAAPGGRCFDCVPEETSLLLGFGAARVEVPALDLVFRHARSLLGEAVHARFGVEFPIRFDLLDTMGGGNLPLQVSPSTEYIQDRFGMHVTQDGSYYVLAAAAGARVYLGLREGIERDAMLQDLRRAQQPGGRFPDERYVASWPAKEHDHFLIPAGTVHAAGRDCVVLEIGAAPYAFGFELWAWERPGPGGRPRPMAIEHGAANIQWQHATAWAEQQAVSPVGPVAAGDGWREERTGLHEREFIETRRHWFTGAVPHDTRGGVDVLNLVAGEEALVESPSGGFEPFLVHYAETFVVPASVGAYTVRPHGPASGSECATIKAFVRTRA